MTRGIKIMRKQLPLIVNRAGAQVPTFQPATAWYIEFNHCKERAITALASRLHCRLIILGYHLDGGYLRYGLPEIA